MPANLTPEYKEAEQQYRKAGTPDEKLLALRRMLATIPKHKGTEKLQADLKRRLARLKQAIQQQTRKKGFAISVEREGVAQVVVVGPPNAGKSCLVAALTDVELESAPYPFTTQRPLPAMMAYEDIQVQLVDLPPVSPVHMESWIPGIVRAADAAILAFDLSSDEVLEQIETTQALLEERKVKLVGGEPTTDSWASVAERRTWLVGCKVDLPRSRENWAVVREALGEGFGMSAVSGETRENVEDLRKEIYTMLRLLRVYSKPPQREADLSRPYVLKEGSTLLDFASLVHHDFAARLKYARVWGQGKFDGQRINKDYRLSDRDVVELHL